MFTFDCETHLFGPMDDISYFPNFRKYMESIRTLSKARGLAGRSEESLSQTTDADWLIKSMDSVGIDMACVLPEAMLNLSHGHRVRSTNGWVAKEIAKYPERLIGVCNVGPIITRGVENAVWELEYLVKEVGFKGCKLYPPEDAPINDRRLWPFYEKVRELRVPLFVHTGTSYVMPGHSQYCHPILLEDVIVDFPEIPIIAYHMGYPHYHELNILAAMHPNLYISTSLLHLFTFGAPRACQKLIGEAIAWVGIDRLIWGTDWSGTLGTHKEQVEFLKNFQISEAVQQDYGFKPLSEEDRQKWAGLNLARILGIEPRKFTK